MQKKSAFLCRLIIFKFFERYLDKVALLPKGVGQYQLFIMPKNLMVLVKNPDEIDIDTPIGVISGF